MLAESIIRVGRPIVKSDLPSHERIRWLTDCDGINCKNFFQHVFLIEIDNDKSSYHFMRVGSGEDKKFEVDNIRNNAYPIIYPQGGNALLAQGTYPIPCYLMYNPHIESMNNPVKFAENVVLPRLKKTITYQKYDEEDIIAISKKIAETIAPHYDSFITSERQLGILYIYDHKLPVFHTMAERKTNLNFLWITESQIRKGQHLYLDADKFRVSPKFNYKIAVG